MQQMEWREELGDARAGKDATRWSPGPPAARRAQAQLAQIAAQIDAGDYAHAAQGVRALMFLENSAKRVRFAFEALEA
jgi:molecular chaperone HscB